MYSKDFADPSHRLSFSGANLVAALTLSRALDALSIVGTSQGQSTGETGREQRRFFSYVPTAHLNFTPGASYPSFTEIKIVQV